VHLTRLTTLAATALAVWLVAAVAHAQDVWAPRADGLKRVEIVRKATSASSYWKPVAQAWRTIVIPARADLPEARPSSAVGFAMPAARPVMPPLTGIAHELGGIASYYWQDQMTSSGEKFNKRALTAAHKTLPLGTWVRVTNLVNSKTTIVRINDRGPFKPGRVIDLSEAAAEQISMTDAGLVRVAIEVVR
jgi:rare lipoprotein A (peptidoglycan hydrolase)